MKKRIVSVMLCAAMGVSLFTGACVVEAKADVFSIRRSPRKSGHI